MSSQAFGGRDAIQPRHLHVHEHDVQPIGTELTRQLQRLFSVQRLAHDTHTVSFIEDLANPTPIERVVVHDQDAQGRGLDGVRLAHVRVNPQRGNLWHTTNL